MALEDKELMLVVRGDGPGAAAAFEELVKRNHAALIGYFSRKSWDTDDAHDRAQEVFLKLWMSRSSYEPRAPFRAYLFQVARNHWIDIVRSRKVRPVMHSESSFAGRETASVIDLQPSSDPLPEDEAESRELKSCIVAAVNALPPGQREVWELAEEKGLSYAEIGEILSIPVGTVKSRHHHAVRKLREDLEQRGIDALGFVSGARRTEEPKP